MRKKNLLLSIILLLSLTACSSNAIMNQSIFYYPRPVLQYNDSNGVIGSEKTTQTIRKSSDSEIIQLYLDGPNSQDLCSPLSEHTELLSVTKDANSIVFIFTNSIVEINPTLLTPSLVALAKTCFEIYDINEIRIQAESVLLNTEQEIIINKDNVFLWDSNVQN